MVIRPTCAVALVFSLATLASAASAQRGPGAPTEAELRSSLARLETQRQQLRSEATRKDAERRDLEQQLERVRRDQQMLDQQLSSLELQVRQLEQALIQPR
jgi:septal ring factor EnvC (AmiA/AmiB activator)